MKHKKMLLLTFLITTLVLCACSTKNPSMMESTSATTATSNTDAHTYPSETETTEPAPNKYSVQLTDASAFSDGVAWVRYTDPYGVRRVGLLHTDGNVHPLDVIGPDSYFGSDFSVGYSYVNLADTFIIIDDLGSIAVQGPEDGSYEIVAGGDGIYLVHQEAKGFDVNEDRYGFIDVNGNWILEPTTELPLADPKHDLPSFSYMGEHIFTSADRGFHFHMYNVDTGDSYYVYDIEETGHFYNGIGMIADTELVYTINTNFETTELFSSHGDIYYSEGIIFRNSQIYKDGDYHDITRFYDTDGEVLIDLSEYKLCRTNADGNFYRFQNGAAAVCIEGADYEEYITLIDLGGNFLVEPMRYHTVQGFGINMKPHGTYSDGMLFVRGEEDAVILCSDGTVQSANCGFGNMHISEIRFSDGYAWYESNDGCWFVNPNGEQLWAYILE